MTQTYKERAEAVTTVVTIPETFAIRAGALDGFRTFTDILVSQQAVIELAADADQQLASKDAEIAVLRGLLQEMADEFVRVYPIYYYAEPWAHDRNAVLQKVRLHLAARQTGEQK